MKKTVSITVMILLIAILAACSGGKKNRYEAEFLELFDTATTIIGYSDSKEEFTEYSRLIYDSLKEYHELYDIYNDYDNVNNIKTINDNAGIKPVKVDKRIIDLLTFSKEAYEYSGGKTNIALGAVLKIWHDYRTEGIDDPENARLPSIDDLREASLHTSIDDIIIDEENSTVFLKDPKMSLDVGAVAKGYATEQVSRIASENGLVSGLISVGGNVRSIGKKADTNEAWSLGIQNPDKESENSILKTVSLSDLSLVTSGSYERYYTVDGKEYNHLIDPDTLFPAEYFSSVSIICQDSGRADALSTAIFVIPLEDGMKLINGLPDVEAMWVHKDGKIEYSSGFQSFLKK